jgi:hypothetical protein
MKKTLTKKELAEELDNRQAYLPKIGSKITDGEIALAKENNLVVVYGYSDDLVEFRGAIRDEVYYKQEFIVTNEGIQTSECEDENCPYFKKEMEKAIENKTAIKIKAHFCGEDLPDDVYEASGEPEWYFTVTPNVKIETFKFFDGDMLCCIGLVFDLDEIFPTKNKKKGND